MIISCYSIDNMVSDNSFFNDGLFVDYSYHNTIENNIVNGKPLVYFEDKSDCEITQAGQVVLVKCNNIKVENSNLSDTDIGIELWDTNNVKFIKNICINNLISIYLKNSSNNIITRNNITSNKENGIHFIFSNNNTINKNDISNNKDGIHLEDSNYNNMTNNNISKNIFGINIIENSMNNIIYHNNFINNSENAYDKCNNYWDDGRYGNYWSDYIERYPNAREKKWKGIWDTPYEIQGGKNKDMYPLLKQWPKSFTYFNSEKQNLMKIQVNCKNSESKNTFDYDVETINYSEKLTIRRVIL